MRSFLVIIDHVPSIFAEGHNPPYQKRFYYSSEATDQEELEEELTRVATNLGVTTIVSFEIIEVPPLVFTSTALRLG